MRILCVCLGNICRSPSAEAVLRHIAPQWQIDSAGTSGWHVGEAPYAPMQAAARARGKKLGRQLGQRPKSDKLAPKVIQSVTDGRSYRWIARDLGISKNTVLDIMKRHRENT